mgnify:CR=1 FL=1
MTEINKTYKTISEVAKILNLVDKKTGKLSTHTLRFWEKKFKQIKPHYFAGNRRYYDFKTIDILKKIQHLLKNKGMTINGVRNYLNQVNSELDENNNKTINKNSIKIKIKNISNIIKNIKNNG